MVDFYWRKGLADATNKSLTSEINSYLVFCRYYRFVPVPVSSDVVCKYASTLAITHAYASIKRYISALGHLHKVRNIDWTIPQDYNVYRVLQGIKRVKGGASFSKLHITPHILELIFSKLDLTISEHRAFWAACLLKFYSFFRKSNIVPESEIKFDPRKHLCVGDIIPSGNGVVIVVRWSKTIQFADRVLEIPIARVGISHLSFPDMWKFYLSLMPSSPLGAAFRFTDTSGKTRILTHDRFTFLLKTSLTASGIDASRYSGHSFRSGGATFAFECGVSPILIKAQGDWLSDAYLRYTRVDWELKWKATTAMALRVESWARG